MVSLMTTQWLIYGANGYTGELIAREAVKQGLTPVLAGRNLQRIRVLADELGLQAKAFALNDVEALATEIEEFDLVLNCAGPFSATAQPMMQACIKSKAHYLDITGEIDVFEQAQSLNDQAQLAGIVLCPGVGFDVIPTDCIAAALKNALPDATSLTLGFDSRSGFSPGTAKTSVEGLAQGGKVRKNGKIISVPLAYGVRRIDFGNGEKLAMSIPWGDVSTAYHSTGIANIEVYIPASPNMVKQAKRANYIRPILKLKPIQNWLKNRIGKRIKGPNQEQREQLITHVWGEASNAKGETKTARIQTANGYNLTVSGSLTVVRFLLEHPEHSGSYTPSKLMGAQLVEQLPGSRKIEIN